MSRFFSFLSSMRLAVTLLCGVGVASMIGTFIKQNETPTNYINQFGPFWFEVFRDLGLFNLYASLPFLIILSFLVLSTSVCVWRQSPAIWRDFSERRTQANINALTALPHSETINVAIVPTADILKKRLSVLGGRMTITESERGILATIRFGRYQRLGYIFTHVAIVVICLGGLIDGQMPLKLQTFFGRYEPIPFTTPTLDTLPARSVISANNPSFRANVFIPEGEERDLGMVVLNDGRLWQKIPFSVRLEKFLIEHYENGMPKNFQSTITILRNSQTPSDSRIPAEGMRAELLVNHPLKIDGYTLYQAGFDDGGSRMEVSGYGLAQGQSLPSFSARIGDTATYSNAEQSYTLELVNFQPFNVQPRPEETATPSVPTSLMAQFTEQLAKVSGHAARGINTDHFRNFGPKLIYKLRDSAGQAVEVETYLWPAELESGQWFWLSGIRQTATEPFAYLRIPIFDGEAVDTWLAIRTRLANPVLRRQAILAYLKTTQNPPLAGDEGLMSLSSSVDKAVSEFLSQGFNFLEPLLSAQPSRNPTERPSALSSASAFNDEQKNKIAETLLGLLRGVVYQAWVEERAATHKEPPPSTNEAVRYTEALLMAYHSALHYPAPFIFMLTGFEEKPATVLQIARAPGQGMVYTGCAALVLGILLMIFVQDRRLFVWLPHAGQSIGTALIAHVVRRGPPTQDEDFARMVQTITARIDAPPPS